MSAFLTLSQYVPEASRLTGLQLMRVMPQLRGGAQTSLGSGIGAHFGGSA